MIWLYHGGYTIWDRQKRESKLGQAVWFCIDDHVYIEVSFGIALGYLRNITYLFSMFSSFTTFIYLMDHVKTFKLILQDVDAEGSIFHNATLRE